MPRAHSEPVSQDAPAGTLGDVGCFSFHARKGVTTGEGGMIVTEDDDLAARMRHLSVFGMETAWSREGRAGFTIPRFANLGYNYKMSDIAAAVGVAQMGKIDGFIARRRSLAEDRGPSARGGRLDQCTRD